MLTSNRGKEQCIGTEYGRLPDRWKLIKVDPGVWYQ